MKRVQWHPDVVDRNQVKHHPVPLLGVFLVELTQVVMFHPFSIEASCIKLLRKHKYRTSIFHAAAFVKSYCTHGSLNRARELFEKLEYPFDAKMTADMSADDIYAFVNEHRTIDSKRVALEWILANKTLSTDVVKHITRFLHATHA